MLSILKEFPVRVLKVSILRKRRDSITFFTFGNLQPRKSKQIIVSQQVKSQSSKFRIPATERIDATFYSGLIRAIILKLFQAWYMYKGFGEFNFFFPLDEISVH